MLRNYFITAFRSLLRNKVYTVLNIGGLIFGVGAALVLFTIAYYESNYDDWHKDGDQVYKVIGSFDEGVITATVPHPLGSALRGNIAGIESISRVFGTNSQISFNEDDRLYKFRQSDIGFADSEYFKILDYEWLAGNQEGVLGEPNSVVISASLAKKYFNLSDNFHLAIGRILKINNHHDLTVKGVFQNQTKQTEFPFQMVASYESQEGVNEYFGEGKVWRRLNGGTGLIFKASENAYASSIVSQINELYQKHETIDGFSFQLQSLKDIHLDTEARGYSGAFYSKGLNLALILIGSLLILAASINFVNLATAKAVNRAKEVGVRKVMGSSRSTLVYQFLIESLIIVSIGHLFALAVGELIFKILAPVIGNELSLTNLPTSIFVAGLVVSVLLITLLSGLYPAFVISSFSPVHVLKTKITSQAKGKVSLRKSLVTLQMIISQVLLIGTIVSLIQVKFLTNKELGFDKEGIVSITLPSIDTLKTELFQERITQIPNVQIASTHLGAPVARTNNTSRYQAAEETGDKYFQTNVKVIDEKYLETFGIDLLAGRNVLKTDPWSNVLVNVAFIKEMGLKDPQEAVGKMIKPKYNPKQRLVIKGVISDFNSFSLHQEVMPVVMQYSKRGFWEVAARFSNMQKASVDQTMNKIEKVWDDVFPASVFEYDFLDDHIESNYEVERRVTSVFQFFCVIAILISALGLYGLVDFMAMKRTKEIGIRKVLGATVGSILKIFTKEIGILLLISFAISTPIMYLLAQEYLSSYAFRVEIGPFIFILSFLVIAAFTILTMGYRSLRAALVNPVNTLKDE